MANKITQKRIQVVFHCICGYNSVDHETMPIRYKDLRKAGVKRKKDRSTGKPFLVQTITSNDCDGLGHFDID